MPSLHNGLLQGDHLFSFTPGKFPCHSIELTEESLLPRHVAYAKRTGEVPIHGPPHVMRTVRDTWSAPETYLPHIYPIKNGFQSNGMMIVSWTLSMRYAKEVVEEAKNI